MGRIEAVPKVYWASALIPFLLISISYFYPLAKVLWLSVSVPKLGFHNFSLLYSSEAIQRIFATTARICFITTIVSMLVGYLLAYMMVHSSPQRRAWILFVVLL